MEGCVLEEENVTELPSDQTEPDEKFDNQAHTPIDPQDVDCTQMPQTEASSFSSESGETTDTSPDAPGKKKPKGKPRKKKPKSTKQLIIGLLIKIAAIVLIVWLVFTFVLGIRIQYGNNMHPMVRDGDLVITFRLQKPFINAAVMYAHNGNTTVGRVVAMEGSVINVTDNGAFTVNGNAPSEEVFYPTYPAEGSEIQYPYTVPQGKVFILNDFREDTNDSRSFGAVDVGDLQGTLLLTLRRRGF